MILQGEIINITRFCTDDGPGIRTTVFKRLSFCRSVQIMPYHRVGEYLCQHVTEPTKEQVKEWEEFFHKRS